MNTTHEHHGKCYGIDIKLVDGGGHELDYDTHYTVEVTKQNGYQVYFGTISGRIAEHLEKMTGKNPNDFLLEAGKQIAEKIEPLKP